MFSSRLLAAAVLVFSTRLFAQENQSTVSATQENGVAGFTSQSAPPAQVRIVPLGTKQTAAEQGSFALKVKVEEELAAADLLPGDTYCLRIRSYVMKRDSKGSDSTHLVSYSTCQPAVKFQVKTIDGPQKSRVPKLQNP